MKVKQIVSELAKEEGKKHQAAVGDVREIVALISDKLAGKNGAKVLSALLLNGIRRKARGLKGA